MYLKVISDDVKLSTRTDTRFKGDNNHISSISQFNPPEGNHSHCYVLQGDLSKSEVQLRIRRAQANPAVVFP